MTADKHIIELYNKSLDSEKLKDIAHSEKISRIYIIGGYQGLKDIYYNYYREQKIKYSEIPPFEDFINTSNIEKFFFNEVFFEVDNKYTTNIGCEIKALCNYYINSEKSIENKKVELISVITKLEEAIYKSITSEFNENPKLYSILKRIENYYRITYSELHEDFYPFIADRPIKQSYGKNFLHAFDKLKETIPLKIALLFYTGELKILRGGNINKFSYKNHVYKSGNSLAIILSVEMNEKVESIKSYLNETYNQNATDKNIFNSDKIINDVNKYALLHGLNLIDIIDIEK